MLQLDTPARKHRAVARTEFPAGTRTTAAVDVPVLAGTRPGHVPGSAVAPGPAATAPAAAAAIDIVDQWGAHSFPASDPPANW